MNTQELDMNIATAQELEDLLDEWGAGGTTQLARKHVIEQLAHEQKVPFAQLVRDVDARRAAAEEYIAKHGSINPYSLLWRHNMRITGTADFDSIDKLAIAYGLPPEAMVNNITRSGNQNTEVQPREGNSAHFNSEKAFRLALASYTSGQNDMYKELLWCALTVEAYAGQINDSADLIDHYGTFIQFINLQTLGLDNLFAAALFAFHKIETRRGTPEEQVHAKVEQRLQRLISVNGGDADHIRELLQGVLIENDRRESEHLSTPKIK